MINNILRSALAFVAASFMTVSTVLITDAQAADGPVVLVFDVDRAIALSKAGKSMAKQLEEQVKSVRAEEKKIVDDLTGELDKLKEQQKLLAKDVLQGKVEELRTKEIEGRQLLAVKTQSIQAGGQNAGREVLKVAEEELSAIAKERKADIVLRRDAVFYASAAIDVTAELVKRLDKRMSSIKVTPVQAKK